VPGLLFIPMSHPADLLARADPSRPLITFYDDATGERLELSGKTFGNWVAKTANLLVDGLGAAPGDRVVLALPGHWQTVVWLFACWSAGLTAVPVGEAAAPPDGDIVAAAPDRLADAVGGEVVGLSLHALGAPLDDCPPGVTDYAVEVRGYGDRFAARPDPEAPVVEYAGEVLSGARLMASVPEVARGGRVLTTVSFAALDELVSGLLAPLAGNGSVIICQNLDESVLDRRISLEHVTAVVPAPVT
jgi:uncharacterized protein (TIGR03089 family)